MNHLRRRLVPLALLLFSACAPVQPPSGALGRPPAGPPRYFDPHNHITGILPYEAYGNLSTYLASFPEPRAGVSSAELQDLYAALQAWYDTKGRTRGDDEPFSPTQRFAPGARATLRLFPAPATPELLRGALERILTATPWTEFDSAYGFRGVILDGYMVEQYKRARGLEEEAARAAIAHDQCVATVLELARTGIQDSEQSMSFIGGWRLKNGRSDRLDTLRCYMQAPQSAEVQESLGKMGRPPPHIQFILMTHTAELAALDDKHEQYSDDSTGACRPTKLPETLRTDPDVIRHALLGEDGTASPGEGGAARSVIDPSERARFYDTVVGIDTAGPETSCFTEAGMRHYEALVKAVYDAAVERRRQGWHGKLLVHTHAGEGMDLYYLTPEGFRRPRTYDDAFRHLPPAQSDHAQARKNIATLLGAIDEVRRDTARFPHLDDYVVFRLGHVTWASREEAERMRQEQVEADVNLESNVATGAYPLDSTSVASLEPFLQQPGSNFKVNDPLALLIPPPRDTDSVGRVLGNASLKYLLESHVPVLLGTDGAGVEHSDIAREYEYADKLVRYWSHHDPDFLRAVGELPVERFFENARWHLENMRSDAPLPYRP